MATRFSVRITRFDDRQAFRRVVDFLGGLYPDRTVADFETALARTPCTLSHNAAEATADALQTSLEKRGAHVMLIPTDLVTGGKVTAVASTMGLSPEIDLSFLDQTRKKAATGRPPHGAVEPPREE
ncbi:MAG: hypothetical protein GY898_29670 [Proteobacteria bacterium]|nr:hypothetical protein [Pseudomonadota bacterium]